MLQPAAGEKPPAEPKPKKERVKKEKKPRKPKQPKEKKPRKRSVFYPQNHVGRGWGIRNGTMGTVRLPKI